MAEKRYCNKYVDVIEVIPREDLHEQKLSCGHSGKRIRVVEKNISVTDELKVIPTEPLNRSQACLHHNIKSVCTVEPVLMLS
jgi:hypothetical protein